MEVPPLPPGRPEIRLRYTSAPFSDDDGLVGSTSHASASTSDDDNGDGHLLDRSAPPPPLPPRPGPAASSSSIRSVSESSIASGLRASTIAATPSFQHVPQVVYGSLALPGEAPSRLSTSDIGSRPPSPAPSDLSGFFSRSRSYDTSQTGTEERQHEFDGALEKLKEIELSEFIERTSKHMDEVHFYDTTKAVVGIPRLDRYRDVKTGQTQYLAFAEAWLAAMADTYLPRDMVSSEKPSKPSISKSLAAMERIYVLLPPQLVQHLLEGKLVALYRWQDPLKTARYSVLYLALWWYDQLPAAVFVFFAYQILKPKIWPPDPEKVKKDLLSRIELSKEAKEIGKDMEQQAKMSHLSHSIASSIGVATMMGGVALNMAPDRASPPLEPEGEDDSYHGTKAKHKLGKRGTYRLVMELLDRFGPTVQLMITDTADLCEKVKNLLLWRRPSATKQSLVIIGTCALVLSVLGSYLQLKLLLLWVWFQFFCVWAIQDKHPRHRRALNPLWYLLWNVPTDAESALEILKSRAADSRPPDEPHAALSRSRTGGSDTLSVRSHGAGHGRSKSLLSLVDSLSSDGGHTSHSSKHFALYKGLPGNLIFTSSHIQFETIKGFRRLSSKLLRKISVNTAEAGSTDSAILFSMPLSSIIAVKKESRLDIGILDTDGLYVTFSNSITMRLASVSRRDEAFAFILSRSRGKTG